MQDMAISQLNTNSIFQHLSHLHRHSCTINMVYPMKKITAYAAAGGQPPSDLESHTSKVEVASDSKAKDKKNAHTEATAATAATRGLDLLFAASSQVVTEPKEADTNGAEDSSTIITVASVTNENGTATAEGEPGSSCDVKKDFSHEYDAVSSNPAADTIKKQQAKTFPQVLQEILTTPEYQSIVHWLPDGLSFVIADKQRFSSEILPKFFREALFHSFVRKLNRWGFRRVKKCGKGEESSFAHNNFVREKPWLCLKMSCKSKPSYHKVTSAKKNAQQHAADAAIILANTARIAMRAHAPPSSLAAGRMVSRGRATFSTFPTATAAAGSPVATTIQDQERQYLASIPPYEHQQRIFHERQIVMFQMRQRHQLQVELQRRKEMSSHNEEQFSNSHNAQRQSSMTAQYTRDVLHRNNYYQKYGYGYGGGRK